MPLILVVGWSFVRALTVTGNLSASERVVEWMRDHHFGSEVSWIEHWYYAQHQPGVGAALVGGIPTGVPAAAGGGRAVAGSGAAGSGAALAAPPSLGVITPFVADPLPGEGVWRAAGDLVAGQPAMAVAYLRPDGSHTGVLAGVVRLDPHLVSLRLVPGRREPGGGPWTGGNQVPSALVPQMLAAFNSGFRLQDSHGGFFSAGRTVGTLRPGAASLVVRADGTAAIGEWGNEVSMTSSVVAVRQNLSLIVDGGQLVAGIDNNAGNRWGVTVGNTLLVWRSGVGIDGEGNLLYAASEGLSVRSLAEVLQRAGAVRAMELDINHPWVSFNLFTHAGSAPSAEKLLPGMDKPATRYLGPDDRDFVAVLARPVPLP